MNIDSHYIIGNGHKVCQDYTLHGETEHFVYGFLCDGCSGAKDTDFGARLIAHAAKNNIDYLEKFFNKGNFWDIFLTTIFSRLESSQFLEKSNIDFLSSTLLCVLHHKQSGKTQYSIFGDGNIIIKYKNGFINRTFLEFENSAPFYPYLNFFKDKNDNFFSKNYYANQPENFSRLVCQNLSPNNEYVFVKKNQTHFYDYCYDFEWIALTSDGVESFQNENSSVSIAKMLDFKNFSGKFVERRSERFARDQEKQDLSWFDDLSLVCLKE